MWCGVVSDGGVDGGGGGTFGWHPGSWEWFFSLLGDVNWGVSRRVRAFV